MTTHNGRAPLSSVPDGQVSRCLPPCPVAAGVMHATLGAHHNLLRFIFFWPWLPRLAAQLEMLTQLPSQLSQTSEVPGRNLELFKIAARHLVQVFPTVKYVR